jgi:Sulfotransferase family
MNKAAFWATVTNPLRPLLKRQGPRRWLGGLTGRKFLHFLHLGKTGGSAVKFVLASRPFGAGRVILLHEHDFTLDQVPEGEAFFFFVRDPVSRFVSAFFSRQRQGLPRIYSPWTPGEEVAFRQFDTPNKLGEALSSEDNQIREAAMQAMRSIRHVNMSYWYWFRDEKYFRARWNDVFFIGFQETLNADFRSLAGRCGFSSRVQLPDNPVAAHRNPGNLDKGLAPAAVANLESWYAADYHFVNLCREWVAEGH